MPGNFNNTKSFKTENIFPDCNRSFLFVLAVVWRVKKKSAKDTPTRAVKCREYNDNATKRSVITAADFHLYYTVRTCCFNWV